MRDANDRDWNLHRNILPVVIGAVRDVIVKLPTDEPERSGGYFCLLERDDLAPTAMVRVGNPAPARLAEYLSRAGAKAHRLRGHSDQEPSSWVTRNLLLGRHYGGAIRAGEYILSFSGLPELAEEAAMLLAAWRLGWLTRDQAGVIATLSNNRFFLDNTWLIAHART
ncbi:hypothetical protein C4552_04045 [Candidatus Parcubacteria bacterium]|nr:MAG: hypothetical protein C4552_04045 [Candidatus Parcubacteria bacterium]